MNSALAKNLWQPATLTPVFFSRLAQAAASARRAGRRRRVFGRRGGHQGQLEAGSQKSSKPERSESQGPVRERRHYRHAPDLRRRRRLHPARLLSVQTLRGTRRFAESCWAEKLGPRFRRKKETGHDRSFISNKFFKSSFCFVRRHRQSFRQKMLKTVWLKKVDNPFVQNFFCRVLPWQWFLWLSIVCRRAFTQSLDFCLEAFQRFLG